MFLLTIIMYYELANIREYKDSKGKPYYTIRLKKESKFKKPQLIALTDVTEIKTLINNSDVKNYIELEAENKRLQEELLKVTDQLKEYNVGYELISSENADIIEEKLQLQEDLLAVNVKHEDLITETNIKIETANTNVAEAKDKIIELQREHKEEIKELNSKLNHEKDTVKFLLNVIADLRQQNRIYSFFKVEPESYKQLDKVTGLPKDNIEINVPKE